MTTLRRNVVLGVLPLLAIPACHSVAPKQQKERAQENWNSVRGGIKTRLAQQHAEAGRFNEAVLAATEALAHDPTREPAYAVLVRANLELGRPATAMQALRAAAGLGVASADLAYLEGVILEQRGETDRAFEQYRAARAADPCNVDFVTAEAECLVALDRPDEALDLLDHNAHRFDESATVAALGGHVAALLGRNDDAIQRYRQALLAAPENTLLQQALGLLLARSARCCEAVQVLRPLVRHAPVTVSPALDATGDGASEGGPAVRLALASCYLSNDEPVAARDLLIEHAARHETDTPAQIVLAKAALATGDLFTAISAVERAWSTQPNNIEVLLLKATVLWQQDRFHEARDVLRRLLKLDPSDRDARRLLAAIERHAPVKGRPGGSPPPQVSGPPETPAMPGRSR